jgi:hypothetical protein
VLNNYLTATQVLLQLPGTAATTLYNTADLIRYINTARGQLAGEAECIRELATINTAIGQQAYNFSTLNTGVQATTGVQGAIHMRSMRYSVPGASGSLWVTPRPWEWFELYYLNNAAPDSGPPTAWAQYGQGAAPGATGSGASGSFYVNPLPDVAYVLNCDCVCYPQPLASDNDVEAIPYLWTDAVPFFAAYYALMSAQTNARMADAIQYYKMYKEFIDRARRASNPSVNRWQYEQAGDPAEATKMGIKSGGGVAQ